MTEKKGRFTKAVITTAVVGSLMWAADRYDITAKIGDAWQGTTAYVVDVATVDPTEAGAGYIGQIKEEKSLAPYQNDIASTVTEATSMLDDSTKNKVINNIFGNQSYDQQRSILQDQALSLNLEDQVDMVGLLERNVNSNLDRLPEDKKNLWQKMKNMSDKAYEWSKDQYKKVF